ncbi:MAG TPA: tetratricopeptide repeat protein, partial [Ardenticatenaceae bacterium]|nr:tetratricopeptide repeat protein [Ardenticatenaceae bacterium]
FVDDLHWADRATLDWLGYLVRRLRDQPLLLIGAYRPEEAPLALVHLVAGWGRESLARVLPLARLTDEESASLIAALGADPLLAHQIHAQSAGNPYFLIELWRARSDEVPSVLKDLVRARLDQLPDTARQVLQAAAILEPDFDFATLRRTSGRGEEETLDALDVLLNASVLTENAANGGGAGAYRFAHPLVASVVRDGLSGARRAFLHRRAGDALVATHAGRVEQIAGLLAGHYANAGELAPAARYAEIAAERALSVAAPEEAAGFYRQAVAYEPTPGRRMGLGRALLRQGDLAGARGAFEAAVGEFEAGGDYQGAARARLNVAETYFPTGRFEEAVRWMTASLATLDAAADPTAHALAHFMMGTSALDSGQPLEVAVAQLDKATALAAEHGLNELAARGRFVLGNTLAERGDLAGAIAAFRASIEYADAAGDEYQEVLGYNNLAYHLLLTGDVDGARQNVEEGLALAEKQSMRLPLQWLFSTRGEIALAEGKWAEAEEWFTRGLAEAERNGHRQQAANYQANLALVARARGELDGALELLQAAREAAERVTAPQLQAQIELWLVELLLERGEAPQAEAALERAEARLADGTRQGLKAWAARLRDGMNGRRDA